MSARNDEKRIRIERTVALHAPALLAYFLRRVNHPHDAADLLAHAVFAGDAAALSPAAPSATDGDGTASPGRCTPSGSGAQAPSPRAATAASARGASRLTGRAPRADAPPGG